MHVLNLKISIFFILLISTACATGDARRVDEEGLVGKKITETPPRFHLGGLWYQLRSSDDGLLVRLRLLRPPPLSSFFLPDHWAGRSDFASKIKILSVTGPLGSRSYKLHKREGRIDVDSSDQPWVEISYRVSLTTRNSATTRYLPEASGDGFFIYGPAVLILPSEQIAGHIRKIPVEVIVPNSFNLAATWSNHQQKKSSQGRGLRAHGFLVEDIRSLRDAFVVASNTISLQRTKKSKLNLAFEDGFKGDRVAITKSIQNILDSYRSRFGQLGPITVFVRAPKGLKHSAIWGAGRKNGFVLELAKKSAIDENVLVLIAHEAFHLWNGHELVAEDASERETRWFKEGLTQYIAIKSLLSLKLISNRKALDLMADAASHYRRNPIIASNRSTPSAAARLPYDRGLLLALMLDDAIQRDSQRASNLDDWLKSLIFLMRARRSVDDAKQGYDHKILRSSLRQFLNDQWTRSHQIWASYVSQKRRINVPRLFMDLGLHWLGATKGRKPKLIPLQDSKQRYQKILNNQSSADESKKRGPVSKAS